jgi:hypothetical protein
MSPFVSIWVHVGPYECNRNMELIGGYLYVCMYVCTDWGLVCMYVCMIGGTCEGEKVCMYVCKAGMYLSIYLLTEVCKVRIHTYAHTYIHTQLLAPIHTYMHTFAHTHTYSCSPQPCLVVQYLARYNVIQTYTHTYKHTYIQLLPTILSSGAAFGALQSMMNSSQPQAQIAGIQLFATLCETGMYVCAYIYIYMSTLCMYMSIVVCMYMCIIVCI